MHGCKPFGIGFCIATVVTAPCNDPYWWFTSTNAWKCLEEGRYAVISCLKSYVLKPILLCGSLFVVAGLKIGYVLKPILFLLFTLYCLLNSLVFVLLFIFYIILLNLLFLPYCLHTLQIKKTDNAENVAIKRVLYMREYLCMWIWMFTCSHSDAHFCRSEMKLKKMEEDLRGKERSSAEGHDH